jgi:hypothetical protein
MKNNYIIKYKIVYKKILNYGNDKKNGVESGNISDNPCNTHPINYGA